MGSKIEFKIPSNYDLVLYPLKNNQPHPSYFPGTLWPHFLGAIHILSRSFALDHIKRLILLCNFLKPLYLKSFIPAATNVCHDNI